MEPIVIVVVLVSALIHAAWNAMVKGEEDALETQAAVVVGGAFFAVPFLFFVPFPNPEAGFYLALSAAIHCAYFAALAVGYRVGDLSFVYPIARGTGPILVALLSAFLMGEILSVPQLASVSIICFGLFTLALSGRAGGGIRAFAFAILVSATIAGYSLTDGIGVRVAQNPWSYIPWLIFVQAIPFLTFVIWRRRDDLTVLYQGQTRTFLLGGFLIGASYGLAMWAFSQERIAIVMALRETAVVCGAVLGAVVFREAYGRWRLIAPLLIATGAVCLNVVE